MADAQDHSTILRDVVPSADLAARSCDTVLIDEYRLDVHPIVIGRGTPGLFTLMAR